MAATEYTASDTELSMLLADLGLFHATPEQEANYCRYIVAAKRAIEKKGIHLDASELDDELLVVMYAAWLIRKRDTGAGMSDMLKYALRNRIVEEVTNRDL